MTLRNKLLLGYAGFVLALGLLGAWSARTLNQMSAVSSRIIAENYDSVVAAQDMKESLERQDSAAQFDLLGQRDRARTQTAEHRVRFDAALALASANITEPGEAEAVVAIREGRDEYYRRFDAFLHASGDRAAVYFQSLEPQFDLVRAAADRLLRLNQEAMRRKADAASQIARRWFFVTLALALFLMAAGVAIELSLSRAIVGPVTELTAATTRLAAGDLETPPVVVRAADEIGVLAVSFNRMADSLRELRRSDLGKLLAAQQTTDTLIEASRRKSAFIAVASQELRAPLTGAQTAIHLLLEGAAGTLDERQRDILQACREDTARLDRLLRDLLDLANLESGAVTPQRAPVRPATLIGEAVDPLRLEADAKGVHLEIDASPDLPLVAADRSQIERVIRNLVANAMATAPEGGTVGVAAVHRGGEVATSVSDTGPGIAPESLAAAFEPFAPVTRPSSSAGTGLGLTISRRIVEGHGGTLSVESAPDRGSTFTFTLPIAAEAPLPVQSH